MKLYHIIFDQGVKCKKEKSPTDLTCPTHDGFFAKNQITDRFVTSSAHVSQVV
jgi:hypothetical protein